MMIPDKASNRLPSGTSAAVESFRSEGQCDCACQQPGTSLSVWMHVTDQCNLRCDYCYLPHQPATMSFETGVEVINSAFRSAKIHDYQSIKFKYAGGEPLLQFPLVLSLHQYAHTLAERNDILLDGIILTNGTMLSPEKVEKMRKGGLRLMISLDGLASYHDVQRHHANGKGTFSTVARSVETAIAGGVIPNISITVSARNVDGVAEIINWVLAKDLPFSVNFYRKNELSKNETDLELGDDHMIEGMRSAFKVIERNLPKRSLLSSLVDRANLAFQHDIPCAAGRDYLVFDPAGQAAKCQMAISHTIAGSSATDPLSMVRSSTEGLLNPSVDDKQDCNGCQWKYYCAGGCPLQAYQATGHYEGKSPNCNIYKALYPEVFRLERLRQQAFS